MQNRRGYKNKVLSNILDKYDKWLFILTFVFNLHLKNIFTSKNFSPLANLLMKKPGNWVAIAKKMRIPPEEERHFKKSICIFT